MLASGFLAELTRRYPEARFTLAANRLVAPLYGAMPQLERIVLMESRPSSLHSLSLWFRSATTLWSLVVDLGSGAFSRVLPALRRRRIGPADRTRHWVTQTAHLLEIPSPARLQLWLAAAHRSAAERLLPDASTAVLAIGPTANRVGKMWPVERFAEAALALTAAEGPLPDAHIAVIAAKHERVLANPLLARLPRERRLDWIGRAPLPVLAAALQRCSLYIGNDSGPMHLAAAAGCPTLGLFGPTNASHSGPWGPQTATVRTSESYKAFLARPGFDPAAQDDCMDGLEVGPVVEAAGQLLQGLQNPGKL